jgi:XTP/dITP diphosphohydrolase
MPDLLIATTNPGKIREIVPILDGSGYRLLTLADVGRAIPEPDETGQTFAENARLKAAYYAGETGLLTVAEDSGLAIDALDGRPGIHSARYPGATYLDKFANLYKELAPHPQPWHARYVCALALVQSPESRVQSPNLTAPLFECAGIVEGEISPTPRGSHGFGYDPIFFFPEYGQTFGEVDDAKKLRVAHRGRAFRQLRDFLVPHRL